MTSADAYAAGPGASRPGALLESSNAPRAAPRAPALRRRCNHRSPTEALHAPENLHAPPNPKPRTPSGAAAFKEFQDQMRFLLDKIRRDGEPPESNMDIGAQVGWAQGWLWSFGYVSWVPKGVLF